MSQPHSGTCDCSDCKEIDNAKNIDLCAEVERLRADIAKLTEDYGDLLIAKTAIESSLAAANALLTDAIPANVCKAPWLTRRDEHFAACGFAPMKGRLAAQPATAPVPMALNCPACGKEHVDTYDQVTGIDWATLPHKTHLCLHCGAQWKPYMFATVGVEQK